MIDLNFLKPLIGPVISPLLDRIPNPNERKRAKEELEGRLLEVLNSGVKGQLELNKQEAAHKSLFVAGWRPAVGWICAIGLFWAAFAPVITWMVALGFPEAPAPPEINSDQLFQILFAMLGMGGLRTFEKLKGVAREK